MSPLRTLVLIPIVALAACASAPEQYAANTECKVVPADFVNVPKKNPTPADRAEAELRMQRFAYSRPGYIVGNDLPSQAVRDCY
jgi:hypothetical protein